MPKQEGEPQPTEESVPDFIKAIDYTQYSEEKLRAEIRQENAAEAEIAAMPEEERKKWEKKQVTIWSRMTRDLAIAELKRRGLDLEE